MMKSCSCFVTKKNEIVQHLVLPFSRFLVVRKREREEKSMEIVTKDEITFRGREEEKKAEIETLLHIGEEADDDDVPSRLSLVQKFTRSSATFEKLKENVVYELGYLQDPPMFGL